MKKFAICALSAGMMMLISMNEVNAFGSSTNVAADKPEMLIFKTSVANLQTKGNNLYKGINTIKKELDSATAKIMKLSIDPKVYDQTAQISTGVFIASRFQDVSSIFDILMKKLMREIEGLKLISKAKKNGNADEISGRRSMRLAMDLGAIMKTMLKTVRSNFALIGQVCKVNTNRMANTGEIKTVINKLYESLSKGKQTQLTPLFSAYIAEVQAVLKTMNREDEMYSLYQYNESYAKITQQIIESYVKLIEKMNTYATTGSVKELITLCEEYEDLLGNAEISNNRKIGIHDELNIIEKNNRRNNKTIRNRIDDDSDYDDVRTYTNEHVKKQRLEKEKYDQLYNRKFQELKEEREAELDDIVSINRKNKNTVQDRRNQRNSQFLNNKNLKNNKLNKSSYYNDDDDDIEYRARKTYGSKYDD